MRRRSKNEGPPPMIRGIVAENVKRLMNERFPSEPNTTAKSRALAGAADTTLSQIQRILSQSVGTSIDIIENLAGAFGVRPQDLLTPYFAATRAALTREQSDGEPESATLSARSR